MIEFSLIAEAGTLEAQAVLLCESIRGFAGAHRNSPILVVSPRSSRRPSVQTISALGELDAEYMEIDIDSVAPEYGPSYRVHSAALVEQRSTADKIVFLDSDMIFTGEPDLSLGEFGAGARPVDVKGMCTSGPSDEFDGYWRDLCRVCGVDYASIPLIMTTIDKCIVKASYNGGFVVVRRTAGIFQQTESFFVQSVQAGLRPHRNRNFQETTGHGVVTGIEAEFWGSSQACLSLAIWGRNLSVRILPPTHNFPLHNEGYVAEFGTQEPLVAIHYHHLFGGDQSHNPLLKGRLNVPSACLDWPARRLPIFE
jgi:hypothetical protein